MKNLLFLLLFITSFFAIGQKIENTEVIHKEAITIKTDSLARGYSLIDIGLTGDSVGGLRMSPMTQAQINALSPSSADSTLIVYNGTDSVYQYWDGNSWENLGGGDNIYTANGSLTGDRTFDLNAFSLTFNKNYSANKDFTVNSYPYSASYNNPYFKINRLGGVEIVSADPTISGSAIKTYSGLASQSGRSIFNVGLRGGGMWNGNAQRVSIAQETGASWLFGLTLQDGYLDITNGTTWSANIHHRFNMRINTSPTTFLHQLGQGSMVIGGSSAVGTEFLSIQGYTLIQGQGSTSATTSLELQNSSGSVSFKTLDDLTVVMPNLPTSSAGLPSGALWNNLGIVNVVP